MSLIAADLSVLRRELRVTSGGDFLFERYPLRACYSFLQFALDRSFIRARLTAECQAVSTKFITELNSRTRFAPAGNQSISGEKK
jgi:hypothetical protein